MMRSKFDEQLELLNTELIKMGSLCEAAIINSIKALTEGDFKPAQMAINIDLDIDRKEHTIENLCLRLLLQQQPVAKDLRQISSALKMITDMERIGDQAADIAEIVMLENITSSDNTTHIGEMAEATIKMVTDSVDAFVKQDLKLAQAVIAYDDVVDDLFDEIKKELVHTCTVEKKKSEYAIDMLLIAKYFERIGDHATNIAEWVEYSITGVRKGETAL